MALFCPGDMVISSDQPTSRQPLISITQSIQCTSIITHPVFSETHSRHAPANERGCYIVTLSLIGWAHTHRKDPCHSSTSDDVITWKHILYHWPFVRGIHMVITDEIPLLKCQLCGASFDISFVVLANSNTSKKYNHLSILHSKYSEVPL